MNSTCVSGNSTVPCTARSSPAGLAVGLTLLFLVVILTASFVLYKFKFRKMFQLQQRTRPKKETDGDTPQSKSHVYVGITREQSVVQSPVYENYPRSAVNQIRSAPEPEEDLYLRCDLPDDAIYNNDPACNLVIHGEYRDEDVYVVPN